jgi:hypothetical protein
MLRQRSTYFLLLALLLFGVILRYPTSTFFAEHGADASYYGALSHIVAARGEIPWAVSPLAYFGLFPYSEGVVTPLLIGTVMQETGLPIDAAMLATGTGLALLGAVGTFLCVMRATRSTIGALIAAYAMLTAPILMYYSDQSLTSRFVAVTWAPFLILTAIERRHWSLSKSAAVSGLIIVLLVATHLSFALIILVFVGILVAANIDEVWRTVRDKIAKSAVVRGVSRHYALAWLSLAALGVLGIGYVAQLAGLESLGTQAYELGVFPSSNVLGYYGNIIASTVGGVGIVAVLLTPFAPRMAGLGHRNWTLPILAAAAIATSLIGFRLYIRPFIATIFSMSAGVGVVALFGWRTLMRTSRRRAILVAGLISVIAASGAVSLAVQAHWNSAEYYTVDNPAYNAFVYIGESTSGNLYCNHYLSDRFLTAHTARLCLPDLPGSGLEMSPFIAGVFPWSGLRVVPNNLSGIISQQSTIELYQVVGYNAYANYYGFSNANSQQIPAELARYGVSYVLEYRPDASDYEVRWNVGLPAPAPFLEVIHASYYLVYQNEEYSLWASP